MPDSTPGLSPADLAAIRGRAACGGYTRSEVIALLDEVARLHDVINGLAERVASQSEALTRRAERPSEP